jgi:hypothetical protein
MEYPGDLFFCTGSMKKFYKELERGSTVIWSQFDAIWSQFDAIMDSTIPWIH